MFYFKINFSILKNIEYYIFTFILITKYFLKLCTMDNIKETTNTTNLKRKSDNINNLNNSNDRNQEASKESKKERIEGETKSSKRDKGPSPRPTKRIRIPVRENNHIQEEISKRISLFNEEEADVLKEKYFHMLENFQDLNEQITGDFNPDFDNSKKYVIEEINMFEKFQKFMELSVKFQNNELKFEPKRHVNIECESKSIHPEMALNKRGIEPYFKINVENINNKSTSLIKNINFDSITTEKLQEFDMCHKKIIIECTNLYLNFLQKINNETNKKHKNTGENSSED